MQQGLRYFINPPALTTGTAAKTQIQITAAAGVLTMVRSMRFRLTGVTAADIPALFELLRLAGGTGTALASTDSSKHDPIDARSIQYTGKYNFTVEPTYVAGNLVTWFGGHAQTGRDIIFMPDAPIVIANAVPLNVRITTASNSVTCNATIEMEEIDIA